MLCRRSWILACCLILTLIMVPPTRALADAGRYTWLAAGDSYSSGEGIPGTSTTNTGPGGKECARADGDGISAAAWAAQAYRDLRTDDDLFAYQSFVACTGALADGFEEQVAEALLESDGLQRFTIASFSFGGNNIGFADVIRGCVDGFSGWGFFDLSPGCDITEAQLRRRVDMLTRSIDIEESEYQGQTTLPELYDQVAERVEPGGDVFVVGYPHLVEEVTRWDAWRGNLLNTCEGITEQDVAMLRSVTGYLNEQIDLAVQAADIRHRSEGVKFHFVDISSRVYETPGGRHGLCSADPWLNGLTAGLQARDIRFERSFHPRQEGYTATGKDLASFMDEVFSFDIPASILNDSTPVLLESVGPIRVGMTYEEAERVSRSDLTVSDDLETGGSCVSVNVSGAPQGLSFMGSDGRIVRIEVFGGSLRTRSGIGIGSTEEQIERAYPGEIAVEPHPYGDVDDYYFVFTPQDSTETRLKLVIETADGLVTSFRTGISEWVDLIEGCA